MITAFEHVTLYAATLDACADPDIAAADEYLAGLADEAAVQAMEPAERARLDAQNEFEQRVYRTSSAYACERVAAEYPRTSKMVYELTRLWCTGKLSKSGQHSLINISRQLDHRRTAYRQQREAELRQEAPAATLAA